MFKDTFPPGNHFDKEDFDEVSKMLIKGLTKSLVYQRIDGQNVFELKMD